MKRNTTSHTMSHAAKTPPIVWVLVADEAIAHLYELPPDLVVGVPLDVVENKYFAGPRR